MKRGKKMTQNEVKTELSAAAAAYRRYHAKHDEMMAFAEQLTIRPMLYAGSGGNSSKVNGTEAGYVALEALEDKVHELYMKWLAARDRVCDMIGLLEDYDAAAVLTYRYLNGCSYEQIAAIMGISDRQVFRLHKSGLKILSNLL